MINQGCPEPTDRLYLREKSRLLDRLDDDYDSGVDYDSGDGDVDYDSGDGDDDYDRRCLK